MYDSIPANYPSTFFYNLSKLQGAFSKNLIKVTADRTTASPQEITNIRLPIGALLNIDSFALWFKVTTSGTNVTVPARYASTFIKRLSLTMNNVSVQIIQDYNLVYNIANDHMNKELLIYPMNNSVSITGWVYLALLLQEYYQVIEQAK